MKLRHKAGAAIAALALVAGVIPGTITSANAYENPNGGQHFDRGRFPRTIHIAAFLGVAAIVGVFLIARSGDDSPTSP